MVLFFNHLFIGINSDTFFYLRVSKRRGSFVCLFVCVRFYGPVNSKGQVEPVSYPSATLGRLAFVAG